MDTESNEPTPRKLYFIDVEHAKAYEQATMATPEFVAMADVVSESLDELCRRSDTEDAYDHGELLRKLILGWVTMAAAIAFQCGQRDASGTGSQ